VSESMVRAVAAVGAIAIFAYPFVAPAFASAKAWLSSMGVADHVKQKMRDIETVLELSSRFSARGIKEGVDLCQKLTEVLLKAQK
jgi:hypothetical protein